MKNNYKGIIIKKDNIGAREVIEQLGYVEMHQDDNNVTYRFKRPVKKLEKIS